MKIALLCIYTGRYDIFFDKFFTSCEKYFCPSNEKHYFVFTDSDNIAQSDKITKVYQDNIGWPFNTLYRYRMFLRVKHLLKTYDKVAFFNGNTLFITQIDFTEFFGNEAKSLVAVIHAGPHGNSKKYPGTYDKNLPLLGPVPFEKRKESLAYTYNEVHYFMGSINAGSTACFLSICELLSNNIEIDLNNGIMAIGHDESHWNAYINNNFNELQSDLHILPQSFSYPEGWDIPFEKKLILIDKNKRGGIANLRNGRGGNTIKLKNLPSKLTRSYYKVIYRLKQVIKHK